jgi:hypothetical protein
VAALVVALLSSFPLAAADYDVSPDHPRLLLPQRQLRLLRREAERQSIRWNQFSSLIKTGATFPEPGFAYALHYIISGEQTTGRRAVAWALSAQATDARQLSLVFDWCQPLLSPADSAAFVKKLAAFLPNKPNPTPSIALQRDRAFAAIVLSGHGDTNVGPVFEEIIDNWWDSLATGLSQGKLVLPITDHFPLYELFHALRYNLDVDLREAAPKYFVTLPIYHLLAHYPLPASASDGDFRLPIAKPDSPPDFRQAALSRAAALSMVAFDVNAQETGFLQGWLIQDAFQMSGPFGAPYEFLWANPYQPGLSYRYLPNVFHDPLNGRLVMRSTWDEDAEWFYQAPGTRQMIRNGKPADILATPVSNPMDFGGATILPVASGTFQVDADSAHSYYLFGLQPHSTYRLEVDDEELHEVSTDSGGVVELSYPAPRKATALLLPAP